MYEKAKYSSVDPKRISDKTNNNDIYDILLIAPKSTLLRSG